jgi:hypothetical protein
VVGLENIDYLVLDRHSNPYPFSPDELNREIDNLVADPSYAIELESDGIYLLRCRGEPQPFFVTDRVVGGTMGLERVDIAVSDDRGILRATNREPVELEPGNKVRVGLYWKALAAPNAERTISVRILDSTGVLVAQHDSLPGNGKKPTSWWQKGWELRDVHYLDIAPTAQSGAGALEIVVYDSHSSEIVPFSASDGDGDAVDALRISNVILSSP